MSLEHSPAREKRRATASALEPLYTREELAARWRCKPEWITRNWSKLGLKPISVGKRKLIPEGQIVAVERGSTDTIDTTTV